MPRRILDRAKAQMAERKQGSTRGEKGKLESAGRIWLRNGYCVLLLQRFIKHLDESTFYIRERLAAIQALRIAGSASGRFA